MTDCVMAELEKLGPKYRIALKIARDERWERSKCTHKGIYADDCIFDRIVRHRYVHLFSGLTYALFFLFLMSVHKLTLLQYCMFYRLSLF